MLRWTGAERDEANVIHLPRLLRLPGERRGQETGSRHDEGSAIHHSMT